MNSTKQTKLYVLTGFLGSGKTTVLLNLLEQLKGSKVGIIQNEFGKSGIDGTVLRNDDIQMVEINRGSIFCSCLKLSFVNALIEMASHDFDYLFVESSGLGDPSNIDEILTAVRAVSGNHYDFCGVLCLIDAVNFLEQLTDLETVHRQLKHCHLAVITKSDLTDGSQIALLEKEIRKINPVCLLTQSILGKIDLDYLNEDLLLYQWAEGEDTTNSEESKPKTLIMEISQPVEQEKLLRFLQDMIPDVYRIKGFINLTDTALYQVDVVGSKIDFKPAGSVEDAKLVFISKIGPSIIKSIFSAWKQEVGTEMKLRN